MHHCARLRICRSAARLLPEAWPAAAQLRRGRRLIRAQRANCPQRQIYFFLRFTDNELRANSPRRNLCNRAPTEQKNARIAGAIPETGQNRAGGESPETASRMPLPERG